MDKIGFINIHSTEYTSCACLMVVRAPRVRVIVVVGNLYNHRRTLVAVTNESYVVVTVVMGWFNPCLMTVRVHVRAH